MGITKKGSIHYHIILFSIPYIEHEELVKLWGHGSVNNKKINVGKKENIGRYISKYLEKNIEDQEFLLK